MQRFLYLYIIFLINFSVIQAQTIHVKIKDNTNKPPENINVQLFENNKIIDFKKTDYTGQCTFQVSEKGFFSLKFTSVFYKTKTVEINTSEQSSFEIELDAQITEIKEVEIKSRPKIVTAKEDTIVFNLKAVRDGTERTTEDLIKKLPGLDITENGKVTYKGTTIGQVLVEGNEFFGKNHKIATQNISANMLDGIDLWQNYTTINGNRSTALNLKLKQEYKGKITGNIETNFGIKNSYLAHGNLFRFGKLGNLALIADFNNIAKDPISYMDFYEMNTEENIAGDDGNLNIEIPTFLNNDGKVKSKNNQFGALQYSKSKKDFSITAFSIFNNAQLEKFSTSKRSSFEGESQAFNFSEQRIENNKGFLGTTQIKMKKSLLDGSFFYYTFGYNPTQDHFNQSIDRYSTDWNFYRIDNSVNNDNFSNSFSWNKQLDKSKIILSFNQFNEKYLGDLHLLSNNNLFLSNTNNLFQRYDVTSNKYSLDFHLKNKNKFINFNIHSGFSFRKDNSELLNFVFRTVENKMKVYHYLNDLNLYKELGKFDISGSLTSHFVNINETDKHYFEKNIRIKFNPKSVINTEFGLEYNSKYTLPNLRLLQSEPIYTKELTYYQNRDITTELLCKTDTYKFTWNRFNMEKGNLLFLLLSYEKAKPIFTSNVSNFEAFSKIENVIGKNRERLFYILSSEYKLHRQLSLKSKFTGSLNKTDNYINSNINTSTIYNFELTQKLSTNFRNKPMQFDLGYTFTEGVFKQSFYSTTSSQNNIRLFLGIRANVKKEWVGNILSEYLIQKTEQNTLHNFLIGGQVSYRKENSNFEYNLQFNNILNLNSFQYINGYTSQLGIEEVSTTALHGYITGGLKYNF